jgi:hypothetical protein
MSFANQSLPIYRNGCANPKSMKLALYRLMTTRGFYINKKIFGLMGHFQARQSRLGGVQL